jgi:ABC-type transport system involved in multi-copper enzyme maturation permease subunit
MTFLPIVVRELQVAARRPATYRLRVLVGGAAALVALVMMVFARFGPAAVGKTMFWTLVVGAFGFCLLEGIRSTADSIAEEKREGTLGLLFLTDLRYYDVVLGKFAAAAVRSFTALFAAFPVLALPVLLGGVTLGEFWRTMLMLVAALALSLAAGMFVSACCRSALAAMGATALLLALVVGLSGTVMTVVSFTGLGAIKPLSLLGGPVIAFREAADNRYALETARYWWSLLGCAGLTVVLLGAASFALAKLWRQTESPSRDRWWQRPLPTANKTAKLRKTIRVGDDPARWLAGRSMSGKRMLWGLVWIVISVSYFLGAFGGSNAVPFVIGVQIATGCLLKLWLATIAPHSLNDARRSGTLELLLCTPLKPNEIVRGQLEMLRDYFMWPALLMAIGSSLAAGVGAGTAGRIDSAPIGAGMAGFGFWFVWMLFYFFDLFAIGYIGLWYGLVEKQLGTAVMRTVIWAVVIPWLTMIIPLLGCFAWVFWPIFLIVSASRRLGRQFRSDVLRSFEPPAKDGRQWYH